MWASGATGADALRALRQPLPVDPVLLAAIDRQRFPDVPAEFVEFVEPFVPSHAPAHSPFPFVLVRGPLEFGHSCRSTRGSLRLHA